MSFEKQVSLKEYLLQELDLSNQGLSFHVKIYLADLLCFYLPAERLFVKKKGEKGSHTKAFVELYQKSQSSFKNQEKLLIFKRMGDFSLYLSGFFRAFIKKRIVHTSYYENIGQNAYSFVSSAYGSKPNIFKELSKEFKKLSQVLFALQKKSLEKQKNSYLLDFKELKEQSLDPVFHKILH